MHTMFCKSQDYVIVKTTEKTLQDRLTNNANILGKPEFTPERFSESGRLGLCVSVTSLG